MNRRYFLVITAALLVVYGCRTVEDAPEQPERETIREPEKEIVPEPLPLDMEWAGTAWIVADAPENNQKNFPGYRGFYLARDGRLFLINQNNAAGDTWSVSGNRISLKLLDGKSDLPVEGTFLIFPEQSTGGIRLVPETEPAASGITFERAVVNVDIIENHWIPRTLRGGENVMWPMNREIHLMLLPDPDGMGILGYGGENRFRGSVQLGDETFIPGPISITRRAGPAMYFENLYVQCISITNRYVQVGDDLFFYSDTLPVAAFRVRLFD